MISFNQCLAARNRSNRDSLRSLFNIYGLNPSTGISNLCKKLLNFRLVAIGDSVMWGQGLRDAEKTFNLVGEFIRQLYPKLSVVVDNFSHSGAIIGDDAERNNSTSKPWGEIPNKFPTILRQVDNSSEEIDNYTDLVLVTGGLNDVDFTTIINPAALGMFALCEESCYTKTKSLLIAIHQKYPNARILISGYYKILSNDSNRLYIPFLLLSTGTIPPIESLIVQEVVLERCKSFFHLSEKYIHKAVLDTAATISNKAIFIGNSWTDANSAFASDPFLFGINADLTPQDNADVMRRRLAECEADLQCQRASAGHPNVNGAKKNAEQFINLIKTDISF